MQARTPHPGDIKGPPPFYLEDQNGNPRTSVCRRSLLRDGGVLCCGGLPGNATESSTNRQVPSFSSLSWRSGGIPGNEPLSYQDRLAWTVKCTNTANGMESRENGTRLLELPGRRSWRRSTSTFNEELRRICSPNIGGAGLLKTRQRTAGVGTIPRGVVMVGAGRAPHNEATQEKQNYSSRAAFPQPNGIRLSSIDRHAENHIRIGGDQATSKQQPFKSPPVHTDNEKVLMPLFPRNFEYRGEDAHIPALNRAIFDSAGAEPALRRGEMPSRSFCINRRISPLAVPLSCGSEQSGSAFLQQQGSSCTQTSWESGANRVSGSCLPSTRSKQEEGGKATSAHRGTRPVHLLSTLQPPKRSKLEWNHECKRECSGGCTICGSEDLHISEHLYSEKRPRGFSCLPPTQPEGSPIDGLSSESYLPHLVTAVAEPPVSRHLQVTAPLSGGQIGTKSEQGGRQDASASSSCTSSKASTCRDYALATSLFSSGLPNCLSETDIHHTSPKERLFHEYCTKSPVTAIGLERFCASRQASGPTEGHGELQVCVFSSEEDERGKKRRECICTNFPLDTLQEPPSHSSFRAVAVVAGEPAETPTKSTVEDTINSKNSSLRPLQDLQGPSLFPSAVVESYEPQPPGQREGTTSSNSASSPRTTQRATEPRRNPQQDEGYHRKIGHPEGRQHSTEKHEKQQRQEAGDENSQRQRMYTTKQNQRGRMAKQKIEEQQQGSKVIDHQVNWPAQHQKEQQGRPLQLQRTNSPRHEEGKKQRLDEPEDNASNEDGICMEGLQQQRRQMHLMDGSASLGTGNRTSSCSPSPGRCKEPPEGIQSRPSSQHFEEDGEQHLQLQHMPEEWLEHEMQALLRQEYQQRQIVQRREEQQHEALQQHPPLERPWVLLAQKQQEEDLRQMHQATLQQMQRELINRHQKQLQARLEEEGRARQEKLEKERQEAIRFNQQQKQNQQKQLKNQQPASGSKPRSVPFTRRKNIYRQHRIQERQDQPPEVPTTEEQNREEMQEKHQQWHRQQGEELQMLDQQQQAKQDQPHSPLEKNGEDDGEAQKHEEHQQLPQQQLEAHQQVETTGETDGAKTTQRKKQRDLLFKNQLPTQRQQPAQQLQQHQQQHGAAIHGEVRQPLQVGDINLTESSKQKVQQALQKGRKSTYAQKGQQKHQLLTRQEGHQRQVAKGEKEQTNLRQPGAGERQKEQEDPKHKEDRSERSDKHRQKYKQLRHNLEEEQAQEEPIGGTEIPQQQGAKTLPVQESPIQRLTQDEGIQNDEPENMGEERVPQAQHQLLSKEKHRAEQQQHRQGERENKKSKGQVQAENQKLRTQQNREHPKQRWVQQKEPHPVSKGPLPQAQVQGLDQQSQQRQQGKQQDMQHQQEQQNQQHHEMCQRELQRERQGQHQEQQQRSNPNPESNSALTRSELLRLSFTPLAAVKESDYYLRHQPPSSTNASLACVPWGIATSTRHQPCSRMHLSDTNRPLVTTPGRRLYEGQRSGDSNIKEPVLTSQQADNYRLSKGQQRILNQRWAPLEITQKQTADCRQAERGGLTKSLFRRRIPLLLPPPPPPPVTETTQLTQHSPEHWKVAPMRGGHQPKNSRSRQRLLQQEQRRLQKQPTEPAVNFPLRAPESTRHREAHQNIEGQTATIQPDVHQQQQQQELPVYEQEAHRDLALPVSSKESDRRSSRSTQRSADGPNSLNVSAPDFRPTWAQKAAELPPEREFPKCEGLSTHKAAHKFVEPARGAVRADLGQRYNEHATYKYHEKQDREFGGSGVGRTQQLHKMQSQIPRCELQVQRVHNQTEEQQQGDRLNPIVLQVHQQLAQARMEFLEEQARVQNRSNRMHALREARQLEEQQQPSAEPPAVIQEEQHHTSQHHHEHQQQQQHQQQEHGDNSVPHFSPLHHQQQPKTGPGQRQEQHEQQQHEQQQKEQQQQEPQKDQQHPYGGQKGQQRGGHTEQQLQQEVRAPSFPVDSIHEPLQTQAPCNGQHQAQQQQLQPVVERMHDYGEHLSGLHRLHFQQQHVWGQQSAWQPQQPLEMQHQQDRQQHTQQQRKQYGQERFHLTQQQQQQQQPPPQQPFIYGQQNTALPQDPSPTTQQPHPLGQQHQQALLQLQPPLSLQQQQNAWLLMNQQRLWLPQQQQLWTPSHQLLWAQQHHQFWQQQQQQQLWQLHHPQAWLQQQQDWWMQHQQLAYVHQQLLHQQEEQQPYRGPPSAQQRVDYFSSHIPAGVLSDIILGTAENAANNGYFVPCGLRMPPPWDGCIPREDIRLGFCPVCLQYVRLDRCLLPFIATPVASSPAAYTSDTAAAEYFYEPQSLLAELSSREQRLPTASADAAGGPPEVSLLPETASRGADGAAEGHEGRCQQTNPTFSANNDNHGSHSMHDSTSSFNDIGRTYGEYPNRSEDTSGSDGVCNSSSSRTSRATQTNHHTNRASLEEEDTGSNIHGSNSTANHLARFEAFGPFEYLTESPSGYSGQASSMVVPATADNNAASILETTTTETYQNQLRWPPQHQLHGGTLPSGGLVGGHRADSSNGSLSSFSSFNPSAPVFVPAYSGRPNTPTFAAAVAAAAAAAGQESRTAGTLGNPAAAIQPWQTATHRPMNSYGNAYPSVLRRQQSQQQRQEIRQHHSQNQHNEQQRVVQAQLPQGNGQYSVDGQSNVQQLQQSNQSLHQFHQSYQRLSRQQYRQQHNELQGNEEQHNEQQQLSQPHAQQWPQNSFPSSIAGSLSETVPSLDTSSHQGSLLVIGACLQCGQFIVRPPVLCLLDQIRARGIGPEETKSCQPVQYEE